MSRLKLVVSPMQLKFPKRPVQALYYTTSKRGPSWFNRRGHSASVINALKAAFKHMIEEPELKAADIYDATQKHVWSIYRHGKSIVARKIGR